MNSKRIVCENKYGDELFSFDYEGEIKILNYNNCEIADIDLDDGVTVFRFQQIDD